MSTHTRGSVLRAAKAAEARSADPTRHKCFIAYHDVDAGEVESFLNAFGHVFIPRVLGVTDADPFIDSSNTDYIMDCIREQYLTDSTVTIVLVGRCTWARRYVDWEVYSTLRNDKNNRRSGLLAITLPSAANYSEKQLPPRVADNVAGEAGYARWWKYPKSAETVRSYIETAFQARATHAHLIVNSRERKKYNSTCS